MGVLLDILSNHVLQCSLFAWTICQTIKYLTGGFRSRDWNIRYFAAPGGMPSSHSAAMTAMAFMVGYRKGFNTELFAACMMIAVVVMYDAAGVRRETGKQGSIINMLLELTAENEPSVRELNAKERVGHTPLQVVIGAVFGVVLAYIFNMLFPA